MIILGNNTVQLAPDENNAKQMFDWLLDEGASCVAAARHVQRRWPYLDEEFFTLLRGETPFEETKIVA